MTKKKAIEAARHRSKTDFSGPSYLYTEASLGWLWEQARIAGLREGVRVLQDKIGSTSWFAQEKLRERANKLAKKARVK